MIFLREAEHSGGCREAVLRGSADTQDHREKWHFEGTHSDWTHEVGILKVKSMVELTDWLGGVGVGGEKETILWRHCCFYALCCCSLCATCTMLFLSFSISSVQPIFQVSAQRSPLTGNPQPLVVMNLSLLLYSPCSTSYTWYFIEAICSVLVPPLSGTLLQNLLVEQDACVIGDAHPLLNWEQQCCIWLRPSKREALYPVIEGALNWV